MGLVVFAADAGSRGWRGGMAVGERDAAVRGGLTAVVALAASARARNCERHIPVLPRGGLDLGLRLGGPFGYWAMICKLAVGPTSALLNFRAARSY